MLVSVLVIAAALLMWLIERFFPARRLPRVRGYWPRAILLNGFQALSVWVVGRRLEPWLQANATPGAIASLDPVLGAAIGYLAITLVYYFWHRARHEVPVLWRWLHQMHHSVSRLEVAASFYKHPLEILANCFVSGVLLFLVLRLDAEAATGATMLGGLAELFYHWNVRTPRWIGYFIQRPEMHRVHHRRGHHRSNYGDLPIWDLLFGTFENPAKADAPTGFEGEGEQRAMAMLLGERVDVASKAAPVRAGLKRSLALLAIGLFGMVSDAAGFGPGVGLAAASSASPLPKVFTRVGEAEPFSARFYLEYDDEGGVRRRIRLDAERYGRLRGPYNRRNVFGAVIAAGPELMADERFEAMVESVLVHAVCGDAPLLRELGIDGARNPVLVREESSARTRLVAHCGEEAAP